MSKHAKKFQTGAMLPLIVFSMGAMAVLMVLVMDLGYVYNVRAELQNVADAAALACVTHNDSTACGVASSSSGTPLKIIGNTKTKIAAVNPKGYDVTTVYPTPCPSTSTQGYCAGVTVEADVPINSLIYFGKPWHLTMSATAGKTTDRAPCVYTSGDFSFNGSSNVTVNDCSVIIEGNLSTTNNGIIINGVGTTTIYGSNTACPNCTPPPVVKTGTTPPTPPTISVPSVTVSVTAPTAPTSTASGSAPNCVRSGSVGAYVFTCQPGVYSATSTTQYGTGGAANRLAVGAYTFAAGNYSFPAGLIISSATSITFTGSSSSTVVFNGAFSANPAIPLTFGPGNYRFVSAVALNPGARVTFNPGAGRTVYFQSGITFNAQSSGTTQTHTFNSGNYWFSTFTGGSRAVINFNTAANDQVFFNGAFNQNSSTPISFGKGNYSFNTFSASSGQLNFGNLAGNTAANFEFRGAASFGSATLDFNTVSGNNVWFKSTFSGAQLTHFHQGSYRFDGDATLGSTTIFNKTANDDTTKTSARGDYVFNGNLNASSDTITSMYSTLYVAADKTIDFSKSTVNLTAPPSCAKGAVNFTIYNPAGANIRSLSMSGSGSDLTLKGVTSLLGHDLTVSGAATLTVEGTFLASSLSVNGNLKPKLSVNSCYNWEPSSIGGISLFD